MNIKRIIVFINIFLIVGLISICNINEYVLISTKNQITENPINDTKMDCILILGAGVEDGKPSLMLKDRLEKGIMLYKSGFAPKIIMSGDHGRTDYDEVNVMKNYAIKKGVPSKDIFMDHAGFNTYDSIYRAKEIFNVKKMYVVSQKYHLPRAIYLSNKLGLDAIGVYAEDISYRGEIYREYRELLARNKDFLLGILKPPSTYLGEEIPVFGSGDITND